jgi:hydroxyacylglutathione hydrolase
MSAAMTTEVYQFLCLKDNYGVLIHDGATGATAAIDAPDGDTVVKAAKDKGWTITDLLITHHHADHTQGIPAVRAAFPGVRVVGPVKEASSIEGLDATVVESDYVKVGDLEAKVIETPGHTAGHIVYWFENDRLAFCGDTLFALGCGRVFETPLAVMWESLGKLAKLPGDTVVYCGHEYTESNARFALTIEPGNGMLKERAEHVIALRGEGKPTVPTTIALELATNPFLRAEHPALSAALGFADADPAQVFGEIRTRKDKF